MNADTLKLFLPSLFVLGFVALLAYLRFLATRVQRRLRGFLKIRGDTAAFLRSNSLSIHQEIDALRAMEDGLSQLGLTHELVGINAIVSSTKPPMVNLPSMLAGNFNRGFGAVISVRRTVGPGKTAELPTGAIRLCAAGDQRGALVLLRTENVFHQEIQFELAVPDTPPARAWGSQLLADLEAWMVSHSIFRGQAVAPTLEPPGVMRLEFADISLPDGIVMEERLRADLDVNFLAFVRHRERLAKMGVPARRGLLLTGPPGSGKTSTCRWLRSQLPDHTFFVVPSQVLGEAKELFGLARRLAPAVVVIEDVDLAMRTPDPAFPNAPLKDLLNQLDGLEDRQDVMVVLTSNSTLPLEQALADRPGRIDHTIRYEAPAGPHRRAMLARAVRDMKLLAPLDDVVSLADGLTAAQLCELTKRAAVRAIQRTPDRDPEVSLLDFRAALDELSASGAAARGEREGKVRRLPKG